MQLSERNRRARHLLAFARLLSARTLGRLFFADCSDPHRCGTDLGYGLAADGWAEVITPCVQQLPAKKPLWFWRLGDPVPPETLRSATSKQRQLIEAGRLTTAEKMSRDIQNRWRFVKAKREPVFVASPKTLKVYGLPTKLEPLHPDQLDHDLLLSDALPYYVSKYGWEFLSRCRSEHCFKANFRNDREKIIDAVVVADPAVPVTPDTLRSHTVCGIESLGRYRQRRVWAFLKYYVLGERVDAVDCW